MDDFDASRSDRYSGELALPGSAAQAARLKAQDLLLVWFVTTPVASFFVRFPAEKSLITYDRAVILLVAAMLVWSYLRRAKHGPGSQNVFGALRFEVAWALLSVLMLINVAVKSTDTGYATRVAVDGFILPLVVFHIARRHFDLRGRGAALLSGAMALGSMLFAMGAYEFVTGTDLLHYSGSELIREGELRVNGPFASDSSFAIISLLVAVFLTFAPAAFGVRMDRAAGRAYKLAVLASVAASLMPRFRVIAVAILICWLIFFASRRAHRRLKERTRRVPLSTLKLHPLTISVVALVAVAATSALLASASLGQRLASLHNVYGRLATWEAAANIAYENPLLGVGISNYRAYFNDKYFEREQSIERLFEGRAALSPHSTPLWVAAEAGAPAFALYLIANVYILLVGYRALKRAGDRGLRAAAACLLALAVAYIVPGLTLTSGIYSDLNLYFFFLLGLLVNRIQKPATRD